jgi:hypothetical protein
MKTVYDVRKAGNRVYVRHVRRFNGVGKFVSAYDVDTILTRGEFEQAGEDGVRDFDEMGMNLWDIPDANHVRYCDAVLPTGGFTEVVVETADGKVYTGKRNFGRRENFCRKIGVKAALGKILAEMA